MFTFGVVVLGDKSGQLSGFKNTVTENGIDLINLTGVNSMIKSLDYNFVGISMESLNIEAILECPMFYTQGLVKYISEGRSYDCSNSLQYIQNETKVIKWEGFERYSSTIQREGHYLAKHLGHQGPFTCHLFLSPKGSLSFPIHTDPDDVVVYVVSGQKDFEHDGGVLTVRAGESLYIPANTPHRAINTHDSLMLSFGLERYLVEYL